MANALITQLNNPVVLQQLNQRLAAIASLLLIVACSWILVEATWLLFPQDDETTLSLQQQNRTPLDRQTQQNSFNKLTAANIFGVSEKTAPSKQVKVPETKLNLTLKGVLAANPMSRASAIIAKGKSGNEDIFSVGDKMPGGILIKEIHPEYVVLELNGRLETLKLQKTSGVEGFTRSNNSASPSSGANSPAAALKLIRGDILKNPTSFGDYALPVVVKENGKQIGYRLQPQKKGQLLAELGVQSSDVITKINGVKLDNPKNGIVALRKLSSAKDIIIVVKRNGVEIPLNISLQ
jgi:general secretion pathway protein C